jgi:hypothetical protein
MSTEFLLVFVSILCILFAIYFSSFYKNAILDKFVSNLPIATHLIIGLGIYITYLIFNVTLQTNVIQQTEDTIKNIYFKTFDVLEKHKNSCPNLVNSFFYPWQKQDFYNENISDAHKDDLLSTFILSNSLFQLVGIYIITADMNSVSGSKFLCFFSNFFNSKLLKKEWENSKLNHGIRSRILIDKLFEINEQNNFKNSEEVIKYFDNFVLTGELTKIIDYKDNTALTIKHFL